MRDGADIRILSEELSVCAGELETLLLRWDEGRLPGLLPSSREGAGEGLSGTRSCHTRTYTEIHTHSQLLHYTQAAADSSENSFLCRRSLLQRLSRCYSNATEHSLLILRSSIFPSPPFLCLSPPSPLSEAIMGSCDHAAEPHPPLQLMRKCAQGKEPAAPCVTLITDVTILEGALCPCAAAAILAMVLRWFI